MIDLAIDGTSYSEISKELKLECGIIIMANLSRVLII